GGGKAEKRESGKAGKRESGKAEKRKSGKAGKRESGKVGTRGKKAGAGGGETDAPTGASPLLISGLFALSIICGAMAMMCKQTAVSLPGAILLAEFLLFDRTWKGWRRKLLWITPLLLLLLVGALYATGVLTGEARFGEFLEDVAEATRETGAVDRWAYLCTQFNVLVIYIRMMFIPIGQSLDHLYPFKTGLLDGFTPFALALLAALAGLAAWSVKKRPIITFSIAWFFITLSVESSVIPISDAMFEHRLYPAMLGFALFLGSLPAYAPSNRRRQAAVAACVVVVILAGAAGLRNRVWKDPLTLWADAAAKNPENHRARSNHGIALYKMGKKTEGEAHLRAALELKPDFAPGHFNLGIAREGRGDLDGAAESYTEAARLKKKYIEPRMNLGVLRGVQGRFDEAADHFKWVLKRKPRSAAAHTNLGVALGRQGKNPEAVAHYRKALEIKPDSGNTHYYLGLALARQGSAEEAARHFRKTLRLIPGHAGARRMLQAGSAPRTGP
ncbi:MAG: tetratricopeptide repeat protein, partial [Desulfobacterales bacterium]|nr:tetratricopeptide repeat protein [Desulfobacterales bacterium]